MVLTDLPGVQRPRDELTRRMQHRVEQELGEADAALMVVNGEQGVGGGGDRWIAEALARGTVPVVVAVNKIDRLDHTRAVAALQAAADLGLDAEVFPVSARTGSGVEPLVRHLAALLPPGPFYFPPDEVSDQPENVLLAELVREQVLRRTRQEVPHAVEVQVEEIEERGELVAVRALLWVETESQKGIVIGAGGRMIKAIGTAARRELERELGVRVHLDLSVRVRRSGGRTTRCSTGSGSRRPAQPQRLEQPGGGRGLEVVHAPARAGADPHLEVRQPGAALEDGLADRVLLQPGGRREHRRAGEPPEAHREPPVLQPPARVAPAQQAVPGSRGGEQQRPGAHAGDE